MNSSAPSSSGATETILMMLPQALFIRMKCSIRGSCSQSSRCAPRFSCERYGPSIFAPWAYAPGTPRCMNAAISRSALSSSSSVSVVVVGKNEVIPLRARKPLILSSAWGVPSLASLPLQPWVWMSIRPGMIYRPVQSSVSAGSEAYRPREQTRSIYAPVIRMSPGVK